MQDHTCFGGHIDIELLMLTVKPVHKLLMYFFDLKRTIHTHVTRFTLTFKA